MSKLGLRAKIVHISDLHFSRRTNVDLIRQLEFIIKDERPDVILVSGDVAENPWPWLMGRARKCLAGLREQCAPKSPHILVIPGNHDYKFTGNVGLRRLTRIPFHMHFREYADDESARQRRRRYAGLLKDALNPWGKKMQDPIEVWSDSKLGLCICSVNSNPLSGMLACGEVRERDLQDIKRRVQEVEEGPQTKGLMSLYRIALVHHHPVPTAYFPESRKDHLFDSFMLFYNAGRFMREIRDHHFHLVLHGHRHCASFCRIGFEEDGFGESIAVVAAGTAGAPESDDNRGHHLNIIEIYHDDTAQLRSHFFSKAQRDLPGSRDYVLHGLTEVKLRRERELQELWGFRARTMHKRAVVTADGYTGVSVANLECRASRKEGVENCPIFLEVRRPYYIRNLELSREPLPPKSTELKFNNESSRTKVAAQIVLGHAETEFSYGYSYRLMNGHTLYMEEFQRRYGTANEHFEYVSAEADVPCEELILEVEFPLKWAPVKEPDVQVVCKRNFRRPDLETADFEEEDHEEEYRRVKGGLRQTQSGWQFRCRDPIPGFLYKIRWQLPALSEVSPLGLEEQSRVERALEKLLLLAERGATNIDIAVRIQGDLRVALDSASGVVLELLARSDQVDDLEITLMAFDVKQGQLRIVLSSMRTSGSWHSFFYAGEGCGGFSFEKRRPVLYHPKRDPDGLYLRPKEISPVHAADAPHSVLISLPWVYEGVVLGTVNLGSHRKPSALERIFDLPEAHQAGIICELNALTNKAANAILFSNDVDGFEEP